MNKRTRYMILREIITIIVGMTLMQFIIIISPGDDIFTDLVLFFVMSIPVLVIHHQIVNIILADKTSLEYKISHCELRKKNGLDYCVECKDGYTCASNIKQ